MKLLYMFKKNFISRLLKTKFQFLFNNQDQSFFRRSYYYQILFQIDSNFNKNECRFFLF
jgi:hypothetical protein